MSGSERADADSASPEVVGVVARAEPGRLRDVDRRDEPGADPVWGVRVAAERQRPTALLAPPRDQRVRPHRAAGVELEAPPVDRQGPEDRAVLRLERALLERAVRGPVAARE